MGSRNELHYMLIVFSDAVGRWRLSASLWIAQGFHTSSRMGRLGYLSLFSKSSRVGTKASILKMMLEMIGQQDLDMILQKS